VRHPTLHAALEDFTADAAVALSEQVAAGAEVPFELEPTSGGRGPALYCYRALTERFIDERLGVLRALTSYASAAAALAAVPGLEHYLELRGVHPMPRAPREQADAALQAILEQVFAGRSDFALQRERFATAYAELEAAAFEGRAVTIVTAPLLGLELDPETLELPLGDGLSLVRGETLEGAPPEAVWGTAGIDAAAEPNVLAMLSVDHARAGQPPLSMARSRFRRLLTALRLFERGGYALGPLAFIRTDSGPWRTAALGASGRPRMATLLSAAQEDELRAFCNLVARRGPGGRADAPGSGELAWALARFEMGCERLAPFEALTDFLLALRALLEPEGPHTGRLAGRLAALCAAPADRAGLAERTAQAVALEQSLITGAPPHAAVDGVVDEIREHLRALLRDVVCGHLGLDLSAVADELLAEAIPLSGSPR
jgi:hypothetical protein